MGVKLVSASGGSVELVAPATATNYTATMPANTGTVITTASTFAGTGPAFSAYQSTSQTISAATNTKLAIDTIEFDTASCYSTSTYRFTPNVAGYYQITGGTYSNATERETILYKNGSQYRYLNAYSTTTSGGTYGTTLVYMNGSTDYLELYMYTLNGATVSVGSPALTYFQGALVRAA